MALFRFISPLKQTAASNLQIYRHFCQTALVAATQTAPPVTSRRPRRVRRARKARIPPREKSLAFRNSCVAKQLHPTKNNGLRADQLYSGSKRRVWWKCPRGHDHVWKAEVSHRTHPVRPTNCPFCANYKTSSTNNLAKAHPRLASEFHPIKNNTKPHLIRPGSHKKVWWKCAQDSSHEWQTHVHARTTQSSGCPFCRTGSKVSESTSLAAVRPDLAELWHPTKNGNLKPSHVRKFSNRVVWWGCEHGHEWKNQIQAQFRRVKGCLFCDSLLQSFPQVAKLWHPRKNAGLDQRLLRSGSTKVVWWQCDVNESHEWAEQVRFVTKKVDNFCPSCYNLSIAFPEIVRFWDSERNGKPAAEVSAAHRFKVWWRCDNDHRWKASVKIMLRSGCPSCKKEE